MEGKLSVKLLDGVLDTIKDFNQSDNAFCSYRFFSHELMRMMPTDPAKGSSAFDAAVNFIGTPSEPVGTSSDNRAAGSALPDKPVMIDAQPDAKPPAGGSAKNAVKISEEIENMEKAARKPANDNFTSRNKTDFILASKSKGLKDCLNDDLDDNSTRKFVTGFLSLAAPPRASQELRQKVWIDLMHIVLRSQKFVDLALCGQTDDPDKQARPEIADDLIAELDGFIQALDITPARAFEEIVSLSLNTLDSTTSAQSVEVSRGAVASSNLVMPMDTMIDNLISLSGRSYKCYAQTRPGQSEPGRDNKDEECQTVMCGEGIKGDSDFRKWARKGDPGQGGDKDTWYKVNNCKEENKYCQPDISQQLILAAAYGSILQRNIKEARDKELKDWMDEGGDLGTIVKMISGILSDRTDRARKASKKAAEETAVEEAKRKAKKEANEARGKEVLMGQFESADDAIKKALSSSEAASKLMQDIDDEGEKRREKDTQKTERERVCSEFPKPFSPYFTVRLMCVLTGKKWDNMKSARPFTTPRTCGARLLAMSKNENLKYIFKDVKQEIDDRLTLMDYSNWIAETSDSKIYSKYSVPAELPQYDVDQGEEKPGEEPDD